MYFKRKSNIIFRDYGAFGYVTDNRNFAYRPKNDDGNCIGDKIISRSGVVFLSILGETAQEFDSLVKNINMQFEDVDIETIT